MKDILDLRFLDNTLERYLWFSAIVLFAFVFKRYLSGLMGSVFYNLLKRYSRENRMKQFNALLFKPASWFIVLITVSFALKLLRFPKMWEVYILDYDLKIILSKLLSILIAVSFTWVLWRVVDFISVILRDRAGQTESKLDDQLVPFFKDLMKILIAVISIGFITGGILHFNIAGILTGLGIGGLALALAAQDTLSNLFGSLTIFLDRPFTVGDLIRVGDVTGTVEKVGFRSTRVRTTEKTFVTIPNKKMTDTSVDNLSLRTHRRVAMTLALSTETSATQMKTVISSLQMFLDNKFGSEPGNIVRFDSLTDSVLGVFIEYYIPENSYTAFMQLKEEVNFKILETLEQSGSKTASPISIIRR